MQYSGVSIKLKTDSSMDFVSGIYLFDGTRECIVSVCPHLTDKLKANDQAELSAACKSSLTSTTIVWDSVRCVGVVPVPGFASWLAKFHQFKIRPTQPPSVSVFEFNSPDKTRLRQQREAMHTLEPEQFVYHSNCRILSSPFGGVNPAMFLDYKSPAIISYVDPFRGYCILDSKYMDDMEGGVILQDEKVCGLVFGELARTGGEGRLLVGLGWNEIANALKLAKVDIGLAPESPVPSTAKLAPSSVVAVCVTLKGSRRAWGSGVIVDKDIVVTNLHVVGSEFLKVEVQFADGTSTQAVAVSEPIMGVDLAFLKLRTINGSTVAEFAKQTPKVDSELYSFGFGLLYPGRLGSVQPLSSRGIVASVYSQKFFIGQAEPECAMIISTASCWNGSSGGGVFNTRNELVGIMASNARDENTGEIRPDMAFVIPVNIVQLSLNCIARRQRLNATTSMQNLWSLKPTHVSMRTRPRL